MLATVTQMISKWVKQMTKCKKRKKEKKNPVSYLGKQWAAVRRKSGDINTPPQIWEPLKWSVNCQGHWPNFACEPPMIRDVDCCRPQSTNGMLVQELSLKTANKHTKWQTHSWDNHIISFISTDILSLKACGVMKQ